MEMMDLVSDNERGIASQAPRASSNYRPDTAFIMMQIDRQKPELQDVLDAVREVFAKFGIKARRSDEFQHDDGITARVLEEITTSEFLFVTSPASGLTCTTKLAMPMRSRSGSYFTSGRARRFTLTLAIAIARNTKT
jgi:hypothetical protein